MLRTLAEDVKDEVLRYLDPSEAGRIRAALAALNAVDPSETQRVLDEYDACCAKASDSPAGPLVRAPEPPASNVEAPQMSAIGRFAGWSAAAAAQALADEPPQAIAAILQRFERAHAKAIIGELPGSFRDDVAARLDTLADSPPDALEEIEAVLAEILSQRESASLDSSRQRTPVQSADAGALQSFADVGALDRAHLRKLLRLIPADLLVIALKGSEVDLLDRFAAAMDERAAQTLCEALAEQAPPQLADIEQAQRQIVRLANQALTDSEMLSS